MKNTIFFILLFALCPLLLVAQAPDTLWTRKYGGDSAEVACSVQQTTDGGFIICGYTFSYGQGTPSEENVFLIKTDANGDTLWTRVFEDPNRFAGQSVQQTNDLGFIIAGVVGPFPEYNGCLIKTDSLGDTLWTRVYTRPGLDCFYNLDQVSAPDSGYIMTGRCHDTLIGLSDIYLVRTDSLGILYWSKSFGRSGSDFGASVQQTSDGGFIIGGTTATRAVDYYLIKTDSNGDTMWTKTFGGLGDEYGRCARQTGDGGYIICGSSTSFGSGDKDIYIVKTDSLGNFSWQKNHGGEGDQICHAIRQTGDGGYVCAGVTTDYYGNYWDAYILRLNADGDSMWTITLGLSVSRAECFHDIQITTDGGYIVAGFATSYGLTDMYVARIAPDTLGIEEQQEEPITQDYLGATILSGPLLLPKGQNCRVFDITGRVVLPDKIKPGIYFLEVEGKVVQKVIKVK